MSQTILSLKDVSIYQDSNLVLEDINLDVQKVILFILLEKQVLEKVVS